MKNFKILKKKYELRAKPEHLIALIDGDQCPNLPDLFKIIAKSLEFPSYFGKNMDALFDMLCDFSWSDAQEVHVVLRNYDNLLSDEKNPNLRIDFLLILHDAAAEWKRMKSKDAISFEVYVEPNTQFKADYDAAMEDA